MQYFERVREVMPLISMLMLHTNGIKNEGFTLLNKVKYGLLKSPRTHSSINRPIGLVTLPVARMHEF